MLNRNLVLGSVAALALTCAAPSYAQSYPRDSSPAEMAETAALNAQQASEPGIIVTPGTTVVASNDTAVANYNSALASQSAAQSQYDSQFNDYQQKRSTYDQQKQDYQQKLDAYNQQRDVYRDNRAIYDLEN